ncbi:MAG: hypothetical protein ACI4XA_03435 [Oscillospiraceae bacterium]
MAKRGDRNKKDKELERTIMRNWIICGVSLALMILLYFMSK